ncbi:MAG: hypothetical protein IT166_09565 [Bryobacterales bacterium]|nr:hypothetical protein [Bryobacterales bacterium]
MVEKRMTVQRIAQRFFLTGSASAAAAASFGPGVCGAIPPSRNSHPFEADTTRRVPPQPGIPCNASLTLSGSPFALHHSAPPTTWMREFARIGMDSAVAIHAPCRRISGASSG